MQALRDFWRFHFLKTLLGLVVIQLVIVAWLQVRNHRPEAIFDEIHMVEGHTAKIQPLRNDTDKDDEDLDSLKIVSVAESLHGKLEQEGKYLFYKAEYGFVGVDSFIYVISDGKKESKEQYIKITIDKNLEPIGIADFAQVYAGGEIKLQVLSNDEDREGDSIFIKEHSKPLYGKLIKVGNEFIYKSNTSKAVIDSFQYVVSDGHNDSEKVAVIVDVKDKSYSCYPWLSCDAGNTAIAGKLAKARNKITIEASGADIWGSSDDMHFVYQRLLGDGEIIARIENLEATHEWAKTGVMIRENLSEGSSNVLSMMSLGHGAKVQYRLKQNEGTSNVGKKEDLKTPQWVKLSREGNTFIGSVSVDGKTWDNFDSQEVSMNKEVFIGLVLTSHSNEKTAKSTFSNVKVKGNIVK